MSCLHLPSEEEQALTDFPCDRKRANLFKKCIYFNHLSKSWSYLKIKTSHRLHQRWAVVPLWTGEDTDQKLRPNVGQNRVKSDKTDGGGQAAKWVSSQWGGKGKQMDKIRSPKWNISSCKSSAWGQKSGCPCSSSLKCIAFEFSRCVNYTQQTRAKGHCWREHSL